MKLYYTPSACSLAEHIVIREAGLPVELERVDLKTRTTERGADFAALCPKGYVPALVLDDGALLTEGSAILQYLADRVPEAGLAPPAGTMERYRLLEWLNFVSTELHKTISPLFYAATPEAYKAQLREKLAKRLAVLDAHLAERKFLVGEGFTVADALLFVVLRWTEPVGIERAAWPAVEAYFARMAARPAVRLAMAEEGLPL